MLAPASADVKLVAAFAVAGGHFGHASFGIFERWFLDRPRGGAGVTEQEAEAGMAAMSEKYREGGDLYVSAD